MEHNNHEKIMFKLGEISEGVKAINIRLDKVNGRLDKHEDKINVLETFRDTLTGKITIIATAVGALVSFITAILIKKI